MPRTVPMEQQVINAQKGRAFAWAKYYETITNGLESDWNVVEVVRIQIEQAELPTHIKSEFIEMAEKLKKKWECPCCFEMIEAKKIKITNCGHFYCEDCLATHIRIQKEKQGDKWECAICRKKHKYPE